MIFLVSMSFNHYRMVHPTQQLDQELEAEEPGEEEFDDSGKI